MVSFSLVDSYYVLITNNRALTVSEIDVKAGVVKKIDE